MVAIGSSLSFPVPLPETASYYQDCHVETVSQVLVGDLDAGMTEVSFWPTTKKGGGSPHCIGQLLGTTNSRMEQIP